MNEEINTQDKAAVCGACCWPNYIGTGGMLLCCLSSEAGSKAFNLSVREPFDGLVQMIIWGVELQSKHLCPF